VKTATTVIDCGIETKITTKYTTMSKSISTTTPPQMKPLNMESWFTSCNDVHHMGHKGNATLARGAFGEVWVAIDTMRNKLVVVKIISQAISGGFGITKKQLKQEVCNEVMALRILSGHDNIVSFLGLSTTSSEIMPSTLCLIFDYYPIDVHSVISRRRVSLTFDTILFISHEILSALQHCHSHGIIHGDVTPKNILISQQGKVCLCDFGLAKPCPQFLEDGTQEGTPSRDDSKAMCTLYYRPPENLLGGPALNDSIDMYSCGLVIAELITGRPLFAGKNVLDQLHRTFQILGTPSTQEPWIKTLPDFSRVTFHQYDPQLLENVLPRANECPKLMTLLKSLIVLDPMQRRSAKKALEEDLCQTIPFGFSAMDLIPTECKGVLFSNTSIEIAEQEALSLAASRRMCNNHKYSQEDEGRSLLATLQGIQT
jgi:serine/threonine protein kinase